MPFCLTVRRTRTPPRYLLVLVLWSIKLCFTESAPPAPRQTTIDPNSFLPLALVITMKHIGYSTVSRVLDTWDVARHTNGDAELGNLIMSKYVPQRQKAAVKGSHFGGLSRLVSHRHPFRRPLLLTDSSFWNQRQKIRLTMSRNMAIPLSLSLILSSSYSVPISSSWKKSAIKWANATKRWASKRPSFPKWGSVSYMAWRQRWAIA